MNTLHIRTLQMDDACRLLRFEQENRHWFEQHIASRGDGFYSPNGVRDHIRQFLDDHLKGRMQPCVILTEDDVMVGRANLKDIDQRTGTAEIGYRIAESQVGRGVATHAVRHLIGLARSSWQLKQLVAHVSSSNVASARVLEKCGFTQGRFEQDCAAGDPPAAGYRFFIDLR
jgi:ribosomal-protein-alanine N-acetyltransferase